MLGLSARLRRFACLGTVALCLACAAPRPKVPPPPDGNYTFRRYTDLQPGWRIRAVTPILKSGKYKPELKEIGANGNTVELSSGDDLIGYETSYYSVRPGKSGVVIVFVSAANTINGKTTRKTNPLVRLFDFPASTRYVRLVFLTRISRADHNQAILAAANLDDLNRLTDEVESDPNANCKSQGESGCTWVPEGIAVRPEMRDPDHRNNYVPAI